MAAVELHKLNGDTSWLVRLPLQPSTSSSSSFFNIVLDPWLQPTPQVDGSPIFSRQTRVEPAAFASLAELDRWLRSLSASESLDAVLFSHPFSDHLHPETVCDADSLAVLRNAKAVFTTADSLPALRALGVDIRAGTVVNLSSAAFRQDVGEAGVLPDGLQIEHLPARDWAASPAWSKLHSGILISCTNAVEPTHVLYSPHGVTPKSIRAKMQQVSVRGPRILIHSFDRQSLPLIGTVACGFPNILDLIPVFRPSAVLATHDEHKQAEGIVGRLINRQTVSLDQANNLVQLHHPRSSCILKQLAPGDCYVAS